jgi:hypothetical protein
VRNAVSCRISKEHALYSLKPRPRSQSCPSSPRLWTDANQVPALAYQAAVVLSVVMVRPTLLPSAMYVLYVSALHTTYASPSCKSSEARQDDRASMLCLRLSISPDIATGAMRGPVRINVRELFAPLRLPRHSSLVTTHVLLYLGTFAIKIPEARLRNACAYPGPSPSRPIHHCDACSHVVLHDSQKVDARGPYDVSAVCCLQACLTSNSRWSLPLWDDGADRSSIERLPTHHADA